MNLYADTNQPVDSNVPSWMDFAQLSRDQGGLGLAPHQAAGLVGNLVQESGPQLTPWGPSGDNGSAWGTAQWRGDRLTGMQDFAKANNMDPKSVQAQQAWMRHEFDTTHADAYNQLSKAATPEDAATAVNQYYERSADKSGQREANARALFAGKPLGSVPALSFANQDDDSEDSTDATSGPLSTNKTLGPGALHRIIAGDDGKGSDSKYDAVAQGLTGIGASLAGITSPAQAYALNQQLAQMRNDSKSKYKYMVTSDGRMVRTDDSGNVDATDAGAVGAKGDTKPFTYIKVKGQDGVERVQIYHAGKLVGGNQAQNEPPPQPTTMEDLQAISPLRAKSVQQVLDGEIDLPKMGLRSSPEQRQLRADALAIGGVDETRIAGRRTLSQEMSKSSPSSAGGQLDSSAASVKHMEDLVDDYTKLHNSSGYAGAVGNWLANKTTAPGSDRDATLANLKNHAKNASDEITKMMTNGHGTDGDRIARVSTLFQPSAAPQTIAAAVKGMLDDMANKRKETTDRVSDIMGDGYMKRSPRFTKYDEALERVYGKIDALSKGGAAPTAAAPAPETGARPPLASFF